LNQSPNALSGLADTNVTEGSSIDGNFLSWNNGNSKWQPVTLFPPYQTGNWYNAVPGQTAGTAVVQTSGKVVCEPFVIYQQVTINQLGVNILVAGSSNFQMALYNNNSSNRPGTEIDDTHGANTVDTTTGVNQVSLGSSDVLSPGIYWFCITQNDSTVKYLSVSNANTFVTGLIGSSAVANTLSNSYTQGVTGSLTYPTGTWGSLGSVTWSDVTTSGVVPIFAYHVSSP
jgi:hypothetical protein